MIKPMIAVASNRKRDGSGTLIGSGAVNGGATGDARMAC
jgi:hypothetical protein